MLARIAIPAVAFLILVPALGSSEPDANTFIQPGTEIVIDGAGCTANFVFKDASSTYIGTAGHCTEGTGRRVTTTGHGAWGTVVVDIDTAVDFALIRVDAGKVASVRNDVQHWGGPTGIASYTETAAGDLLAIYGYGIAFSVSEPTRAKQGVLISDSPSTYVADTWAVFGDSGGPVLHKSTGKALGIVSQFNLPLSTDIGPTIPAIQAALAARGYNVVMQTAPATGALV